MAEWLTKSLEAKKSAIEKEHGPWTAHNFHLKNGLFTMKEAVLGDEIKLRRILQIIADVASRPLSELRILDLACLEGMYSIELARRGSRLCAIEGRDANLEKARFAAQALNLIPQIDFHKDDVRNLSTTKYGTFDVILCLGILYHLDAPDLFNFIEQVYALCEHFVVIDTHISLHPETPFPHNKREYWGKSVMEHPPGSSAQEIKNRLWSSLDNPQSVYLTRSSLLRLLSDTGFSSVYECHVPEEPGKPEDRLTLLAVKGDRLRPVICPQLEEGDAREIPESFPEIPVNPSASKGRLLSRMGKLLPDGWKRNLKKIFSSGS